MNELVSVIIPCHNSSKTIERTIYSVLKQSYQNIEILVVDDCSSDDTVEKIKNIKDKRIRLFQNSTNLKAGLSRNVGMDNAKGDYISFLDSDDAFRIDKLEKDIEFLNNHKEFDVVCNNFTSLALYTKPYEDKPFEFWEIDIKSLLKRASIFTSTLVMRKNVKERFPKDFHISEDLLYWSMILLAGHRVARTNLVTTYYNMELTNRLSLNYRKQYINEKKICDYVYEHGAISKKERKNFKFLYFLKYLRRPFKFKLMAVKERKLEKAGDKK